MTDLSAPAPEVARALLGAILWARCPAGEVAVRLTETEAYAGAQDPASHAYRGRTARNAVMFGPAGVLYVYRSHGLHWCANITVGAQGDAAAVLLRAGEVVAGVEVARLRRGPVPDVRLARGPGNLAAALGLSGDDDGTPLGRGRLTLAPATPGGERAIACGPRVGVTGAPDLRWRFWLLGEPTVTPYRRSPRAAPPGG